MSSPLADGPAPAPSRAAPRTAPRTTPPEPPRPAPRAAPRRGTRNRSDRLLRIAVWGLTLVLGTVQAWGLRHTMFEDGPSYMDVGDSFARGDWRGAVNGYWSPVYPWLLGLVLRVVRPSPYWEYPVVHLVTVALLLVALACFERFLGEWLRWRVGRRSADAAAGHGEGHDVAESLTDRGWRVAGYTAFLVGTLHWIGFGPVSPDMLVAALVLLAAARTLRLQRTTDSARGARAAAVLGLVLGVGYLVKVAMLPLAPTWILGALRSPPGNRRRAPDARGAGLRRAAIALAVLVLVAAPFVIALSVQKGRFTVGDSPRINRAFSLHALARRGFNPLHWRGIPEGTGEPVHPTRLLYATLPTYEFRTPLAGTFPVWRDPSYWLDGLRPPPGIAKRQAQIVREHLGIYARLLWPLALGLAALLALGGRRAARDVARAWPAWLPAAAALAMYALVHVESRFLGGMLPLLALGVLGAPRVPRARARLAGLAVIASLGLLALPLARALPSQLRRAMHGLPDRGDRSPTMRLVDALGRAGLGAGDEVAVVGIELRSAVWARLARMRVVASIPSPSADGFWRAPPAVRDSALAALRTAGVRWVVLAVPPPASGIVPPGWTPLTPTRSWLGDLEVIVGR